MRGVSRACKGLNSVLRMTQLLTVNIRPILLEGEFCRAALG